MPPFPFDTIAAISTPPGHGGIAILRMSGERVLSILGRLFAHRSGKREKSFHPRHMHFGHALDASGDILDEALAVYMPGPHSATGEDVGEIHCHGGPGVTFALLEAAFAAGARMAEPGEFTRRAFLNGRLDLTQAEAVAELISAPTREGARLAAAKLDGVLGRELRDLRASLDALRGQVAVAVDFPDEDVEVFSRDHFSAVLRQCGQTLERLLGAYKRARLWREGATAVLTGLVNAGKSSLLNALLGRERAIVSERPGTTRDYIEESLSLAGMPVRLIDTAGLRRGGDVIEEEGIRRARSLADEADVLLFVVDAQHGPQPEDREFLQRYRDLATEGRLILALNKIDRLGVAGDSVASAHEQALILGRRFLENVFSVSGDSPDIVRRIPCIAVSARFGQGLDALQEALRVALEQLGGASAHGDIAPNLRQSQLLREARVELELLEEAVRAEHPPDILGVHLDAVTDILSSVTDSASTEELLDSIFSTFCIGK